MESVATGIEPLLVPSLRDACIARLEELILSGRLKIGERLPPERRLADQFGVSRPVVHQAIVDLAAKGLVEVVPRKGVFVNDFRATGSCALLTTLLSYREGELDEPFLHSLVDMRLLMETETARLAALYRTEEQVQQFQHILARETRTDRNDARGLADLDFDFHQLVAQASDNLMYLLIINSFEPVYTNITRRFFGKFPSDGVLDQVFAYHRRLVAAIAAGDGDAATAIMAEMLHHGAANLLQDPGGSSHGD